ncbi:MAG: DUF1801 domain-containing protein [Promethearchaeota archaeon]|nr:MAG: DUF1801 domain-containing protein [Candidatus Lokiarchaeota archaeon]
MRKRYFVSSLHCLIQNHKTPVNQLYSILQLMNMDEKVEDYIEKQPSPQKEICWKLREIILNTLPNTNEEMKWGTPVYCGHKIYIGSFKEQVNLGFEVKNLTEEEIKLLEGTGKTMRHIKIHSLEEIDKEKIVKFIQLVSK